MGFCLFKNQKSSQISHVGPLTLCCCVWQAQQEVPSWLEDSALGSGCPGFAMAPSKRYNCTPSNPKKVTNHIVTFIFNVGYQHAIVLSLTRHRIPASRALPFKTTADQASQLLRLQPTTTTTGSEDEKSTGCNAIVLYFKFILLIYFVWQFLTLVLIHLLGLACSRWLCGNVALFEKVVWNAFEVLLKCCVRVYSFLLI